MKKINNFIRKLTQAIVKIVLFLLITVLFITIVGELVVRTFVPQLTFSRVYLLSDKCYEQSVITPFTLQKNAQCRMYEGNGDFDVYAHTNSLGLRGKDISLEKLPGERRLLLLGDSFTFGYGLSDESTIPVKLEAFMSATGSALTVINAGFADGYGPDSYYAYLRKVGLTFSPDAVGLLFFPYNDFNDITESVWDSLDERQLPTSVYSNARIVDQGIFRFRNTEYEYTVPIFRESHLFQLTIKTLRERFKLFKNKIFPTEGSYRVGCALDPTCIDILLVREQEKFYKIIRGLQLVTEEKGIPFFVVIIPTDYQLYPQAFIKYSHARPVDPRQRDFIQRRVTQKFDAMNIPYLDLYPTFLEATSGAYPFFDHDAHFNDVGSTIATRAIGQYILEKGILQK